MKSTRERSSTIQKIVQNIHTILNDDHNTMLLKEISEQEVEESIMWIPFGKARGLNGFTIKFFKVCWPIIKGEFHAIVEDSRWVKTFLGALNANFITLIPKEEGENSLERYHPISLSNVIYRIISKIIANRLKPLFPLLLYPSQSSYVEGRKYFYNIILSHETIHPQNFQEAWDVDATWHVKIIWQDKLEIHERSAQGLWTSLGTSFGEVQRKKWNGL